MAQRNIPLDPNSTNDRVPAIAKAREIAAHIIPPKNLFDFWPRAKSVRETYAAIAACNAVGIKQPTYFELSCVAGISTPSATTAVRKLEAAGLVVRSQAEAGHSGVRYDYMIPPLSDGGE